VIDQAVATAPHGHKLDRTLNAKTTLICVLAGCLFPGEGYDTTLRISFGLPGLGLKPGTTVPAGPALSKARALLGEHVMRQVFEPDAVRADVELGIGSTWHGMETTAFDGTTAELFSNDELAGAFGIPTGGTKPRLRIVAHVRTGSRRWIGAAAGGYHDGENALVDELAATLRPGMLNLADRGFFSMDRWIRFSATGAHLCWRVKNGAKSVPFKTLKTLPDGSELVILHESNGMPGTRRRDIAGKTAPRLPDTIARLVQFTIVTRTARDRTKTSAIRVLTTLLDHAAFPAAEIAALHAERWQIEIADDEQGGMRRAACRPPGRDAPGPRAKSAGNGDLRMVLRVEPEQDLDEPGPRQGDAADGRRAEPDVQEDRAAQPGSAGRVVGDHSRVIVRGHVVHRLGTGAGIVPVRVDPLVVTGAGRVVVPVVVAVGVPEREREVQLALHPEEEADPEGA